jgi:hypothetical protein
MYTSLLDEMPRLVDDELFTAASGAIEAPARDSDGIIRIGIEGPFGKVYRIFETTSVVEAVRLFETLHEHGLHGDHGRREAGLALTRVCSRQPQQP